MPPPAALTPEQLEELSAELKYELRRLTPPGPAPDIVGGPALGARAQARMLLILDALSRIREGTYGTCTDCRAGISYERLSAIPEARTCIGCGWSRQVEQGARA
jgi:hypothetical protein